MEFYGDTGAGDGRSDSTVSLGTGGTTTATAVLAVISAEETVLCLTRHVER